MTVKKESTPIIDSLKKPITTPVIKKEPKTEITPVIVKKEPSPPKRKNTNIESDDDLPLVCSSSRIFLINFFVFL
jgi:hypothetical protein